MIALWSAVGLSACGVQDSRTADVRLLADYADTGAGVAVALSTDARVSGAYGGSRGFGHPSAGGDALAFGTEMGGGAGMGDGSMGGNELLQSDAVESIGGRATYEGTAGGVYALGERSLRYQYFGAQVRLTADLGDNYIWGAITDGKDTRTHASIFDRLTLEPAAFAADETAFFENRLTGVVGGKLLNGEWSGRFSGAGAGSVDSQRAVAGTFRAESDAPGESLAGFFDAAYQERTVRTVEALNGFSEKAKGRLAERMAIRSDTVSSTDVPDTGGAETGDVSWNTGVTRSSRNTFFGGVQVNQAINARYEGDALVFDRINFSSQPPERLTTSNEPETPGYRQASSPMPGSPRWKGVEYLSIESSRRWNYSIMFSDIRDNEDPDYLAGGFSISLPDPDDPANTQNPWFTVAASGNDPFQAANIEPLQGRATYDGDAAGVYASKITTPALRYFNADVRLTADFASNGIEGVVTEGRDTATNELIFKELGLSIRRWTTEQTASFQGWVSGVVNGRAFAGDWGGQFFGNGESVTDSPGSVAGTFGARSQDRTESLWGFFAAYDRERTRLPSGHGLAADKIIVQPGDSIKRGHVSISCPEGGLTCIVTVEPDGSTFYDRDGGAASLIGAHSQDNPTAQDLLDHWNQPEPLRVALGLSAVAPADIVGRKSAVAGVINAAGGDSAETGTGLSNVQPDDVEIIGERDGITYGRWTGGPAGTLNIEFDWRFAEHASAATRARMERAGKEWSWRILDDFGTHVVESGTAIRHGDSSGTFDEDVSTDGILIVMHVWTDPDTDTPSSARPLRFSIYDDGPLNGEEYNAWDDYEAWLGSIGLHPYATYFAMVHEVGHVLGIGSSSFLPPGARHRNRVDHTFEGPEAVRANGGTAVPFRWSHPDHGTVAPHTPGSGVDSGHLGVCNSIMAFCRDRTVPYRPSEIDFAFLSDIGYEILDAETASEPEIYGYGAWGRYSAWGVGVERTIVHEDDSGLTFGVRDSLRAAVDAFGMASSATLAETHAPMQGSLTWSGSLIGVDLGRRMLPPVFGDAEIRVELSSLQGTATFSDLTVHVGGVSSAFRAPRLEYDIGVDGNVFSDEDGHVLGELFGPAHEEMAGVLHERTADVNLLAGFGGKR